MVRKQPVGFEKYAAFGVRAERLQHLLHEKSARAVARIDYRFKALERMHIILRIDAAAYHVGSRLGINGKKINPFGNNFHVVEYEIRVLRRIEYTCDIAFFKPAAAREELQPVALVREMACRDHYGAVEHVAGRDGAHEHGGGACKAEIGD